MYNELLIVMLHIKRIKYNLEKTKGLFMFGRYDGAVFYGILI
jgi:hypothetical protein